MSEAPSPHPDTIERLLNKLCVELGFCLPPADSLRLIKNPPTDADEFAAAVFQAEGMDPRLHLQLFRQVRDIVRERFSISN